MQENMGQKTITKMFRNAPKVDPKTAPKTGPKFESKINTKSKRPLNKISGADEDIQQQNEIKPNKKLKTDADMISSDNIHEELESKLKLINNAKYTGPNKFNQS